MHFSCHPLLLTEKVLTCTFSESINFCYKRVYNVCTVTESIVFVMNKLEQYIKKQNKIICEDKERTLISLGLTEKEYSPNNLETWQYSKYDYVDGEKRYYREVILKKKLVIKKKALKGEDGYKTFSIRIKDETVDRLNELAKKTNRTRNELINILLDYAMNECEVEDN